MMLSKPGIPFHWGGVSGDNTLFFGLASHGSIHVARQARYLDDLEQTRILVKASENDSLILFSQLRHDYNAVRQST